MKRTHNNIVVDIRKGSKTDLNALLKLHQFWQKEELFDLSHGYLSVRYSKTTLLRMIECDDLFVFEGDQGLLGYVLVNAVTNSKRMDAVKRLYFKTKGEVELKMIAFGYQIVVDYPLQGSGFIKYAQQTYFDWFRQRYYILVSTVSKQNFRSIHAHSMSGWTFLDVSPDFYIIERYLV